MTEEIKGAVAQALQENQSGNNMSVSQLADRRLKQLQPLGESVEEPQVQEEVQEASEEVQSTEEVQEVAEQVTTEASEEEEPKSEEEVLSQYNLDEMSEEDLKELADKLGSRAVARFGELTAKRKAAEEKLAELQSSIQENKKDVLQEVQEVQDNPYSNLGTMQDLKDKAKEVNEIISWAEDTLFEADGYSADDVVTEIEGKEVTKAQVRKSLLQARKARDTYLPDQLSTLQKKENAVQLESAFKEQAEKELDWLQGEDNDTRKRYESMMQDKRFQKLKETVDPDISAQLPYIIAHAANSIYGRKVIKEKPNNVSLNPPKTGAQAAPTTSRAKKGTKALADLNSRFKDSGNRDDFVKMRTLQLQR
jgi:hypothetical protein